MVDERIQGFLAATNLLHGNEMAFIVDVQHRLDVQKRARPGACLRDASAAPQEHEVVDGEPVRQVEPMLLHPVAKLLDREALTRLLNRMPYEQAFAARRGKRIDGENLALGKFGGKLVTQKRDCLVRSRKAARESQVENVSPGFQKATQKRFGIGQIGKRSRDDLALAHHRVKLLQIGDLAFKVALALLTIDHERQRKHVETELVDHFLFQVAA